MPWADATSGQKIVILTNGVLRAAQVVAGAFIISLYISEKNYWLGSGAVSRINFEFAVGTFAIVTGLTLGIMPFKLSYRPVAFAFGWDFIMFLMYCAAFGEMKNGLNQIAQSGHKVYHNMELYLSHLLSVKHKLWVNLAGLLLFLASAIMGAILLWVGKRNGRNGRHNAV